MLRVLVGLERRTSSGLRVVGVLVPAENFDVLVVCCWFSRTSPNHVIFSLCWYKFL